MYFRQIESINKQLNYTNKAIISLGCSFVQGQGAVNDELYLDYTWDYKGLGYPLEIEVTETQKKHILKTYPSVKEGPHGKLDFTFMEYDNSFVNVLCNKYFNGEYIPINLGIRGCGNRATIKELYFRPEINWNKIDEIVVIYCPSGLERFDFVNDAWHEHFHWKCMWPHFNGESKTSRDKLWEGYNKTLWSEKQGVIEQIAHVQELLLWCNHKNAKLIIVPGFDRRYNKKDFEDALRQEIDRDIDGEMKSSRSTIMLGKEKADLVKLFPWDKMFKPQGYDTFADLAMAQDPAIETNDFFFQFLGKGSPDGWITPCSHPSAKAHDLFAKELYNFIKGKYA